MLAKIVLLLRVVVRFVTPARLVFRLKHVLHVRPARFATPVRVVIHGRVVVRSVLPVIVVTLSRNALDVMSATLVNLGIHVSLVIPVRSATPVNRRLHVILATLVRVAMGRAKAVMCPVICVSVAKNR